MSLTLPLARIAGLLEISATARGLELTPLGAAPADPALPATAPEELPPTSWPSSVLSTSAGAQLALDAEQVIDRGLGFIDVGTVVVPWEEFGSVVDARISLASQFADPSPFLLAIDRESEIGRPDFAYRYSYLLGGRETRVERAGYFVRHNASKRVYVLDPATYRLLDAMDRYNGAPENEQTTALAWEAFAAIRADAESLGVRLEEYLASNRVVVPSSIALDYEYHEDGSLSFVPRCPEFSGAEFATVFQRNPKAARVYTWDDADGRRVRIVLTERQQAVLERMKRVRRARGEERLKAEREPQAFFDGVLGDVEIKYGPRVTGVGDLTFTPIPANPQGGSLLGQILSGHGEEPSNGAAAGQDSRPPSGDVAPESAPNDDGERESYARITVDHAAGDGPHEVAFSSAAAFVSFRERVAKAVARGEPSIRHEGVDIRVDEELLKALHRSRGAKAAPTSGPTGRKYLLIYTNENELVEDDVARLEQAAGDAPDAPFTLPASLSHEVTLKRHQLDGVQWLARCSALAPARRGVLLADDMGLGKTLQVLVHLARLIEAGALKDRPQQGEEGPWRPILIVAPLMLVENETWPREMRERFRFDGEIFRPVLTLHGQTISRVRAAAAERGQETVLGKPLLDAAKLMQHRVIVTTYETVVNYQHSFAQLVHGRPLWSAIVSDEAQRYKMLNTKISVALKAVPTSFHIASTGTPVENRLLDLWNIVDTFQPALLGTASEFSRTYEAPARNGEAEQRTALDQLRARLHVGAPSAFLLRRGKAELTDLPEKREQPILCDMSREEHDLHAACLDVLREDGPPGRHLAVLQRLALLSQHPLLTSDGVPPLSARELLERSSKLRATLEQLEEIRTHGEKAIIFARHVAVQNLLALVIGDRMHIRVPIINGSTAGPPDATRSSEMTRRTRESRKRVLDDFRTAPGFGVIVLSPFVAGVGLTITEANHVIHYGRWWNPAVEAQATDRAYRIGQTRPVTVYYPILRDPWAAEGSSFDEVLDKLLARKRALAHDFLHPIADEDGAASELRADLLGVTGRQAAPEAVLDQKAIDRLSASDFEALLAAAFTKEGASTILTCASGDGGIDVIAVRRGRGMMAQAKHVRSQGQVDADAVRDVLAGLDTYRGRLGGTWNACVVSSGQFTAECRREASGVGVELIDGNELAARVRRLTVTLQDVLRHADTRCATFEEGVRQTLRVLR